MGLYHSLSPSASRSGAFEEVLIMAPKHLSKKQMREAKKAEKRKESRERDRMAAEEADSGAAWQVSVLYSCW